MPSRVSAAPITRQMTAVMAGARGGERGVEFYRRMPMLRCSVHVALHPDKPFGRVGLDRSDRAVADAWQIFLGFSHEPAIWLNDAGKRASGREDLNQRGDLISLPV